VHSENSCAGQLEHNGQTAVHRYRGAHLRGMGSARNSRGDEGMGGCADMRICMTTEVTNLILMTTVWIFDGDILLVALILWEQSECKRRMRDLLEHECSAMLPAQPRHVA
jgi:hypothetical protein